MSSDKTKEYVSTNEEIIEELTKDLEKSCVEGNHKTDSLSTTDENFSKGKSNIVNDSSSLDENKQDNAADPIPSDFEYSDSEKDDNSSSRPDDFIDETQLQELEKTLTPEELQNRHKEAIKLKEEGNEQFKSEKYLESVKTYTKALQICPLEHKSDRSILYSNRAASKIKLKFIDPAIDDCSKAIELNPNYVRAYLRRAKLYEENDKLDESLEDYKKILEVDPGNKEAVAATIRLPPLINERNEKMKTEMLGKLKDLGNMILRPFGLSTENFQVQQDPNTGGYSINFQQDRKN